MTLIDHLLELSTDPTTLLDTITLHGQAVIGQAVIGQAVAIHQHGHYRWVYTGDQSIQSVLSLDAPEQLNLINQNMMLVALLLCDKPQRILNLGFGGGSFERFFTARHPTASIVSVDIDVELVALAKQYLQVPAEWPVIIQSADDFLQGNLQQSLHKKVDTFNLILCDIFNGEYHADCVNQQSFYANAAANLTTDGAMAINLAPQSDQALISILGFARHYFTTVMISNVANQQNVVMLLAKSTLPTMAQLQLRAADAADKWQLDFVDWLTGFKLLPR